MTARHSPLQQVKEAKQIAKDHGCFVVERQTPTGLIWLLYRGMQHGRNILIGKRASPAGIRSLVCKATGFK